LKTRVSSFVAACIACCSLAPSIVAAQVLSGTANVNLNATLAQSLSISITSGSTVNFTLVNGNVATGSNPVVVSTSWNLSPLIVGAVSLYGYFSTPSQALTDGGGNNIASTLVQGRMTTGIPVTYVAFTQTNPVGPAGGSLALFTEVVTALNAVKTRSDNLDLEINLTGQTLPAATYTGVLTLQARAI
jgi:hypothetical protein